MGGLAGCSGPQFEPVLQRAGGEERQRYVDDPDDRVFKTVIDVVPSDLSTIWDFTPRGTRFEQSDVLFRTTHEPGLWGRWWSSNFWHDPGPVIPRLYDQVEIDPETISIQIRDDATWSDGEPVRAYDILATVAAWRMPRPPVDEIGWTPTPAEGGLIDSVGSYSLPHGKDGRRIDLHLQARQAWNDIGGFEGLPRGELLYELGGPSPRMGVRTPTHLEPYASIAAEAIQDFDDRAADARSVAGLAAQHVTREDITDFRRPERFVSTGPWTLDRIVGTQAVVLKPNEHHRLVEDLDIEAVVLEFLRSQRLVHELRQGLVDYASAGMPDSQVEFMSDSLERRFSPTWYGRGIGVDHSSVFGDPFVRQAMLYALDVGAMLDAYDIPGLEPVTIPGGDLWRAEHYLGASWIDESLRSYAVDRDRARAVLERAGFARRSDGRWEREGVELTGSLVSDAADPVMAELEAQLGDIGISMEVQPVNLDRVNLPTGSITTPTNVVNFAPGWDVLEERWEGDDSAQRIEEEYGGRGEADLWHGDQAADRMAGTVVGLLDHWTDGLAERRLVRARNYFGHEEQEQGLQAYSETGRVGPNIDAWKDWTIELPPLGEPDGQRQPFNPAYTAAQVMSNRRLPADPQSENPFYSPPRDSRHEENATYFWRLFAWTANWWLPALPLVKFQQQHFYEAERWMWPDEHADKTLREMWDYFGNGWRAPSLLSMTLITPRD